MKTDLFCWQYLFFRSPSLIKDPSLSISRLLLKPGWFLVVTRNLFLITFYCWFLRFILGGRSGLIVQKITPRCQVWPHHSVIRSPDDPTCVHFHINTLRHLMMSHTHSRLLEAVSCAHCLSTWQGSRQWQQHTHHIVCHRWSGPRWPTKEWYNPPD